MRQRTSLTSYSPKHLYLSQSTDLAIDVKAMVAIASATAPVLIAKALWH